MSSVSFREIGLNAQPVVVPTPVPLGPAPQPDRRSPLEPLASEHDGASQLFCNGFLNSRVPAKFPTAESWERTVKAPIGEDFMPQALVVNDKSVVLSTALGLLTFDHEGGPVGGNVVAQSPPLIVPSQTHVLYVDRNGYVAGRPLGAGGSSFLFSPSYGATFSRNLISIFGERLIVVGEKLIPALEQEETSAPEPEIAIDAWVWPEKVETDEDDYPVNADMVRALAAKASDHVACRSGDRLAMGFPGNLFQLDGSLSIKKVFTGSFVPVAMSGDEAGYLYIVLLLDSAYRLVVINPEGKQTGTIGLSAPPSSGFTPPIVGYDHTIYVPGEGLITILDPQGEPRRPIRISNAFAGATVTSDHRLLVGDGQRLVAYADGAEPVVLTEFEGEMIRTAPVLLKSGAIWVATNKNLYCLKPGKP